MRLIGVPNSPYFRRTAIALDLLDVRFETEALSPFIDTEAIRAINPVIKVPSLVCDDGDVIMDSSLIIQFVESTLTNGRSLWPDDPQQLQRDYRAVSVALAALEKTLQIVYETRLRPESARHEPWLERIQAQARAAFDELERAVSARAEDFARGHGQAAITAAVTWTFAQGVVPDIAVAAQSPALMALSDRLEASPVFQRWTSDTGG